MREVVETFQLMVLAINRPDVNDLHEINDDAVVLEKSAADAAGVNDLVH